MQGVVLHTVKHLKIGIHGMAVVAIITFATLLRILVTALGWPLTNSDEDTIGIMGLHIAYHGDHPIFFYGQNYMGATEAYIGAGLFHIFGSSVFTLRLGLIVLVTLFLVSTYLLANLLYTKKLALFSLVLLGLGSDAMLTRQLTAIGGYPETLLFGSLAFLLATWLAFTCRQGMTQRERWIRYLGYGCWGLVVGLGLWSDLLIIPFVLMSGSLVLLFCWRDVRTLAPVFLLLGLFVGAFPLIVYNLGAPPGQDSLSVLWSLQHADAGVSHSLQAQIKSAIQVSLPTATGSPFCLGSELSLFGPPVPHTRPCTIVGAGTISFRPPTNSKMHWSTISCVLGPPTSTQTTGRAIALPLSATKKSSAVSLTTIFNRTTIAITPII